VRVIREITLVEVHCGRCDLTFAVPDYWQRDRRATGESWWCPNGHERVYREPENARLKRELEAARARATHAEDQRQAAERSAAAHRGQATRLRKRVANGVCPCCNRSFQNLHRHMSTQHPDYTESEAMT
jgi:hypothetical protein